MNKGTALGGAAFVLSGGLVIHALLSPAPEVPEVSPPAARSSELSALQAKVDALQARVATLEAEALKPPSAPSAPTSQAPAPRGAEAASAGGPSAAATNSGAPTPPARRASGQEAQAVLAKVDERIEVAVDQKLEEIKLKWNKKPALETVAKLLELDERQARVVEEKVREGQKEIRAILDQPTTSGANLLDELVNAMAHGQRPEAGALWGRWFGRLQSEQVPGTNLSYAARLEEAKASVRKGFREVMSPEQYQEFEEWAFDPTEVQGISESPWEDFGERVAARSAELARARQEQ